MADRQGYLDNDSAHVAIQQGVYWQCADITGTPQWSPVNIASATKITLIAPSAAIAIAVNPQVSAWISPNDASAGGLSNATSHGFFCAPNTFMQFPIKGGGTCSIVGTSGATASTTCGFAFVMLNSVKAYDTLNG
jgi:hypothetical protein